MAQVGTAKPKAGRKYSGDNGGLTSLKRDYIVILDAPLAENGETLSFQGVPAIGSAHPSYPGLRVQSYDVAEGESGDKIVLIVTVNYGTETQETSGEGEDAVSCIVEEWGWEDGSDERELVTDVDGKQVLNSAGDPFDTVPKYSAPSPTFVKVMKFKDRQTGWNTATCCVNAAPITIGGIQFPAASLLCTITEKRLIGNPVWKYQYTVRLKYKSNKVNLNGSDNLTDIGWDVAVADAGMRAKGLDEKLHIIRRPDEETGRMCTVTSAALLNGEGEELGEDQTPYNFRFKAYERTTIPSWCYSEPTAAEEGLED